MKRLLLLLTVCCLGLSGYTQSWKELYDSTNDCWGSDWQACTDILEQARIAAKTEFGIQDSNYALTINDLGLCYDALQQYDKAMDLLKEAISLMKSIHGEAHVNYGEALNSLGITYVKISRYKDALPILKEAVVSTEKAVGKAHPLYGKRIASLAIAYQELSQYDIALKLLHEALDNTEQSLGKQHPLYGLRLNNLAEGYIGMDQYEQAVPLLLEAVKHTEETLGKDHYYYGLRLSNLGKLYRVMGDYEAALPVLQEALIQTEKVLGKQHAEYGLRLNVLGQLFMSMRKYEEALPLFKAALQTIEQSLGKQDQYYAMMLGNYGNSLQKLKQYDSALVVYRETLAHVEQQLGILHPDYAASLNDLGVCLAEQGKLEDALPVLENSRAYTEQSLGKFHTQYGKVLQNLGQLYQHHNKQEAALTLYHELFDLLTHQLATQFDALNDRLQSRYLEQKKNQFALISSFSYAHPAYRSLHGIGFTLQLLQKGFLQDKQIDLIQSLRTHPDTSLQELYADWRDLHAQLAQLYQQPLSQRHSSFDSLRAQADQWETTLANQSLDFRKTRKQIQWQEIQATLSVDQAVIEYAHFPYSNKGNATDSVLYVAYVLRAEDSLPWMIPLCEEQALKKLLTSEEQQENLDQLYAFRGIKPRKAQSQSQSLADLIWQPLDHLLKEKKTIYYSPAGLLHRMNFAAIPFDKKSLLMDRFSLIQLGSSRSLAFKSDNQTSNSSQTAVLLGGIIYDDAEAVIESNRSELAEASMLEEVVISSRGNTNSWQFLPASSLEVAQISHILSQYDLHPSVQTGKDGSEEFLYQLETSPYILHLATHGYFFEDPDRSAMSEIEQEQLLPLQLSDHPMVRSGLILAGANHAWAGNPVPDGQEDGILTAYEISRMDLSNTELVVLSACETGLGDIQGNEGVYGLQRAFKIAGAKYILMSLWQVPDQATQELMTAFYEKWLGGMEIRAALQEAQRKMRKKYKEAYYWAGFVLVE
ncbi:MAG: CHAT domain-containing tetratricopeptide repeat protein [Bacteroidota bacterium]